MTSLVLTITETLRYRGKIGQWAWALHRIAGIGTVVFLIMHVIDTSWATFYPDLYAKAIAAYKTPLFTAGEFALVACVVYHALNGFRIVLFDYRPQWWRRQAEAARLVLLGTVVLLVPTFLIMAGHVVNYYNEKGTFDLGLELLIEAVAPFAVGTVVVLGIGFAAALVTTVIPAFNQKKSRLKGSAQQKFRWTLMRVSGVLIIPLVFGHLAMVHLIQGVFDIAKPGFTPVGVTAPNLTEPEAVGAAPIVHHNTLIGKSLNGQELFYAVNFVRLRWDTMLAGVYIWRIYDILLLALVVSHGFNGLTYVIDDYFKNKLIRRTLNIASFGTMVGVLAVGALAILQSVPATTVEMLNQTSQAITLDESVRPE